MTRVFARLVALASALLLPAMALATDVVDLPVEGHGEHGWDTTAIAASFFNFVVLIGLFVYLFRGSLNKFLKERRATVEQALTEAARLKAEAEAKYKEYSDRMATLDQELAGIKSELLAAGHKERDRIIADAEHKAARMRREAEFVIEQQLKQWRTELSNEAAEAAVQAAEDLLMRSTTTYDQQRLAQEYLNSLATKSPSETKKSAPSLAENHA